MSLGTSSELKFDIGHVLFIDIVGYSKLLLAEQSNQMQTLREIVRGTEQFKKAESLTAAPAGLEDVIANSGMASTLRFGKFAGAKVYGSGYDINGSGNTKGDTLVVAVYVKNGQPEGRIRVSPKESFAGQLANR